MFKQNFINFCNKKGESPSFVCRQVGLAPATFTCWNEKSIPRQATLQRIAHYFNVTPEDLLRDPDERPAPAVGGDVPDVPNRPPLSPEFYELLNQMTLQELAELKATMEEKIRSRKS